MAETEEPDESLQERLEQAFEEADGEDPWRISGTTPEGEEVSDRVRREDVLALDRSDEEEAR